jgi:hypothetical protein
MAAMAKRKSKPPRKLKFEERTSQGHRVSVLKRLGHLVRGKSRVAFEAFVVSDYFALSLHGMSGYDRGVTWNAVFKFSAAVGAFQGPEEAPPFSQRLEWTDERRAKLREVAEAYGLAPGLDKLIARHLGIPLAAATLARYREIGRIRGDQSSRRPRRGGTHGGRLTSPASSPDRAANGNCKYVA